MRPIPDFTAAASPDPLIALPRKRPVRHRPARPGEPIGRLSAATEASCGWSVCADHNGVGRSAGVGSRDGGSGGAGVGRGEADLPRGGPGRPPLARCCGAKTRSGPGCRGLAMENGRCWMHAGPAPGRGRRRGSRSWPPRAPGTAGMARPSGRCAGIIGCLSNGPGCWPRRRRSGRICRPI